jgi:RNA polymerase sigma factor (sigma-70 family)
MERVNLDAGDIALPVTDAVNEELLVINEALAELAALDPRKAELVKLRYFAGLTIEEAAEALEISAATAKRDWTFSRAWLARSIQEKS